MSPHQFVAQLLLGVLLPRLLLAVLLPRLLFAALFPLLLLAVLLPALAMATEPASSCLDAATAAERAWTLPPDLIGAIGRVESGRPDRTTSRLIPWPWTVNAAGHGSYFETLDEAVGYVRMLQARGVRMIDVGCFQIDLFYHPMAFASLEQAFDPAANANYAARFLTALRGQAGSWPAAIAGYHAGGATEAAGYRLKVVSQWGPGAALAGLAGGRDVQQAGDHRFGLSARLPGLSPGLPSGHPSSGHSSGPLAGHAVDRRPDQDRYVVLMSVVARAIRIIGPSAASGLHR